MNDYPLFGMHFNKSVMAILNRVELCPIVLQNVQVSDTTEDDSSNNEGNKRIIPKSGYNDLFLQTQNP